MGELDNLKQLKIVDGPSDASRQATPVQVFLADGSEFPKDKAAFRAWLGTEPVEYDLAAELEAGFTTTGLRAVRHSSESEINMVTWEGDITFPASAPDGTLVLTTVLDIAPKQGTTIGIFSDDGTDYGVLRFEEDGDVRVYGSITGAKKYTLSGITIIDPYRKG